MESERVERGDREQKQKETLSKQLRANPLAELL